MDPEQSRLHEMFVCEETMKKRCETTEAFLSECLILESDSEPYRVRYKSCRQRNMD